NFIDGEPRLPSTVPDRAFAAGVLDEDAAHGFGRRSKEMSAAIPLWMIFSDQSQPRFMNQRGRLEGLVWPLLRHLRRSELAQLIVHERQQLIRSLRVALLRGLQNTCDVAHAPRIDQG